MRCKVSAIVLYRVVSVNTKEGERGREIEKNFRKLKQTREKVVRAVVNLPRQRCGKVGARRSRVKQQN